MSANAIVQCAFYLVVLVGLGLPLGAYMARVHTGDARSAQRLLGRFPPYS
jgi:hypothetical protein